MNSEYTVGAVADIIARLSKQNNEDSPKDNKKNKKRKLKSNETFEENDADDEGQIEIKEKRKKTKTKKSQNKTEQLNNNHESDEDDEIIDKLYPNINKTKKKKKRKHETASDKNTLDNMEKKNKELKQKLEILEKVKEKIIKSTKNLQKIIPSDNTEVNSNMENKKSKKKHKLKKKIENLEKIKEEENKLNENLSKNKNKKINKEIKEKVVTNGLVVKDKNINEVSEKNNKNETINKKSKKKNKKLNFGIEEKMTNDKLVKDKKTNKVNIEVGKDAEENINEKQIEKGFPKHDKSNEIFSDGKEKVFNEEEESRTIFVGNLPLDISRDKVISLFKQYGPIETVRFRSVPIADLSIPRSACIKMKKIHEKRTNQNAYVRFVNKESVQKALEVNGNVVQEHTLRVDLALQKDQQNSYAIFIGNLPFEAEEEELRKLFQCCGEIESVRIIRDQQTNIGKGFGYVNFTSSDGVAFALELENVKVRNREIRIKRCFDKKSKFNSGFNQNNKRDFNGRKDSRDFNSRYRETNSFNGNFSKSKFNSKGSNFGDKGRFGDKKSFGNKGSFGGDRRQRNDIKKRDFGRDKFSNDNGGKRDFGRNKFSKNNDNSDKKFSHKSFRGSTVTTEKDKNQQKKKKLGYDALKKFIIAKKLNNSSGEKKKKSFSFLSSS